MRLSAAEHEEIQRILRLANPEREAGAVTQGQHPIERPPARSEPPSGSAFLTGVIPILGGRALFLRLRGLLPNCA